MTQIDLSQLPYGHPLWVEGFLIPLGELQTQQRILEQDIRLALHQQRINEPGAPSHTQIKEWMDTLKEVKQEIKRISNLYHPPKPLNHIQETLEKEFAKLCKSDQ